MSAKGIHVSLLFIAVLLSVPSYGATGQININTRHQTIEGFGAAGAWYEGWLTAHPNRETLYNLFFESGEDKQLFRLTNQ